MREGWVIKILGDCCEILNGFAFKSDKYTDRGTRVIRITNVQKGYIVDDDPKYYSDCEMANLGQYRLNENDLLMSLTGNVGRIGLLQKEMLPAALNQRVACLRIKGKDISLRYLFHCLNSAVFEQKAIFSASGIAQKNMSTEWLKKYKIPIPPLPEQKRIVAELDCLSSIIEKQKEQLKELDNLAQSIFYTMFGDPITNEKGWEIRKLGDICNSELGKMLDTKRAKGEYHPYLCALNVQWGAFNMDVVKEMRIEENELERYTVKNGDVLICEGGDTGRTAIWNSDNTIYYQNSLHRVRLHKDKLLSAVFLHIMHILKASGEIDKYSTGQTIKHLVKKSLLSIPFIIPALSLQQDFASKIEAIEKQKELIKQSIAESETLFNSRMDYYFN